MAGTALIKRAQELGVSTVVEHGNLTEPQVAFFLEQFQGCPDADVRAFFWTVEHYGLNPYGVAQIYGIPRNTRVQVGGEWVNQKRLTIQVGINGLVAIAQRTGRYAGMTLPEWCGDDGRWVGFWNVGEMVDGRDSRGKPTRTMEIVPPSACRVGVCIRGQSAPSWFVANWVESADFDAKTGEPRNLWKTKPALMLAKTAQAGALRRTFQDDFESLRAEFSVREDRPAPRIEDLYPAEEQDRPRLVMGDVVSEDDEPDAASDSAPSFEQPKQEPAPRQAAQQPARQGKDPDGSQAFWAYALIQREPKLTPESAAKLLGATSMLEWTQSGKSWAAALEALRATEPAPEPPESGPITTDQWETLLELWDAQGNPQDALDIRSRELFGIDALALTATQADAFITELQRSAGGQPAMALGGSGGDPVDSRRSKR